jgi:putative ATPase
MSGGDGRVDAVSTDGLFELDEPAAEPVTPERPAAPGSRTPAPLAVRMRPRTLDEVVGQQHLLRPGAPLRRLVEGGAAASVLLYGPPGTGKTTIARLLAGVGDRHFVALSALSSGVKELRQVIDDARRRRDYRGQQTVLFIDEVHRFSKTQQDALLGAVEDRLVLLVAATTENPSFSVVSPLLSRSLVLQLQSLTEDDVRALLRRAVADQRGLDGVVELTDEAENALVRLAAGDARRALTALEAAADGVAAEGATEIDVAAVERAVTEATVRYDRAGDQHYDVISAFIKSIRGSDPDAALHYLARMLVAGEDPRPDGAAGRGGRRPGRAAGRAARMPTGAGPGHGAPGHRPEVQRSDHRNRRGDGRRPRRRGRRGTAAPAGRALRGGAEAGQRRRLPLPARGARGRARAAVPTRRTGRP